MTEVATRTTLNSAKNFITQSEFYSPAFNGAIFDGPLRLYFAQAQEGAALKFYFALRARANKVDWSRKGPQNLFVMLYPNDEIFDHCFNSQGVFGNLDKDGCLPMGRLGSDIVIALKIQELEIDLENKVEQVLKIIS